MLHVPETSEPRVARPAADAPDAPDNRGPRSAQPRRPHRFASRIGSLVLLLVMVLAGILLASWKRGQLAAQAAAVQPEPIETITAAEVQAQPYLRTTTTIGTLLALRSVTLRNEEAGTVAESRLETGAIVEQGDLLVALDVGVEQAELRALQAQSVLAETLLERVERASKNQGASEADVDRARAEREVALANIARIEAVIARKTIRAPFRARIGLSDLHVGQYLAQGTQLTTLQSVDEELHVDFSVPQDIAAGLAVGRQVTVLVGHESRAVQAEIVALDARVDPMTRNALVRARVPGDSPAARPGSAVRVRVPIGEAREVSVVPVSALRRGPAGDHVFVLLPDDSGALRAHERRIVSGATLGDVVVVESGLARDEQVAASGSFKLFEGVQVNVVPDPSDATPSN
jgi:membrane fusion protein (multidrug efflux system)